MAGGGVEHAAAVRLLHPRVENRYAVVPGRLAVAIAVAVAATAVTAVASAVAILATLAILTITVIRRRCGGVLNGNIQRKLLVVVLGVVEFSRALAGSDRRIDLAPQIVAAVVVLLSGAFLELWLHWVALFAALAFVVVWRLITQMAAADGRRYSAVTSDVLAGTFVVFYVPFLASMAMVLLRQDAGEWWIIAFIAVAVVADTAAYASGLTFGKHPMAPRISPNKTWEGFIGAAFSTVIMGFFCSALFARCPRSEPPPYF